MMLRPLAIVAAASLAGCAGGPVQDPAPAETPRPSDAPVKEPASLTPPAEQAGGWTEVFPGVRVNRALRALEFDGEVSVDAHDPETPDVYLEVVVCTRDTREHEALVVTDVLPSHVHAGLLLLGFEPGSPGRWASAGRRTTLEQPTGPGIDVRFITTDPRGTRLSERASAWIMLANDAEERDLLDTGEPGWRFSGSRMAVRNGRELYDADGTGQLVGLHTFGSETVAFGRVMSPESAVETPVWLADNERIPTYRTPVTVRLTAWPE